MASERVRKPHRAAAICGKRVMQGLEFNPSCLLKTVMGQRLMNVSMGLTKVFMYKLSYCFPANIDYRMEIYKCMRKIN